MKGHSKTALLVSGIALAATSLSARPAPAQVTYQYQGSAFTLFSCGPNSTNTATLLCATPAPANLQTSYTASDRVTATIQLDSALPANLPLQDIRSFPGFSLTMNDGHQTLTDGDALGMFAEVATDGAGDIVHWRLVINTGGLLNGGISTMNSTFVSDGGTLACCHPTVAGNLARVSGIPGAWTSITSTPTPADAVNDLLNLVSAPASGLTAGQISSLTDKLDNALASIGAGSNKQAINQLNAFINSVNSAAKTGKIAPGTAASLTAAANAIIAML